MSSFRRKLWKWTAGTFAVLVILLGLALGVFRIVLAQVPDYRDQIAFRDALREDPSLRDRYAALKQDLVVRLGDAGRGRYADEKTDFVRTATPPAR